MKFHSSPRALAAGIGVAVCVVLLSGCTDDVDPVRPVADAHKSMQDVCIVTNRMGRLAYTTDSVQCAKPGATLSEAIPTAQFNPGLYGMTSWFPHSLGGEQDHKYVAATDLGATMIRLAIHWETVEPNMTGGWDAGGVASIHAEIDAYAARNIDVYFVMTGGTPAWAQKCQYVGIPNVQWGWVDSLNVDCHQSEWNPPVPEYEYRLAAAMNFMVDEFGFAHDGHAAVKYFAYGNEPQSFFWPRQQPANATTRLNKFVQISHLMANAVHRYSGLKFVGAEANDGDDSVAWILAYLQQASSFTDILAFHAYGAPNTFERHFLGEGWGASIVEHYEAVRNNTAWYGYNLPLWLTEWGAENYTDDGIQRAAVYDVLQHFSLHPDSRLERAFYFTEYVPWVPSGWEYQRGLIQLTPSYVATRHAYFCFGAIARLHQIPANGASCPTWTPPFYYVVPSNDVVYSYITGPGELGDDESGSFTAHLSNGHSPSACDWWIDGQFAETGGCTTSFSWSDGPTYHTLNAIVYDGEIDIASSDKPVTIYNGGCPTCNYDKRKSLPGNTTRFRRKNRMASSLASWARGATEEVNDDELGR